MRAQLAATRWAMVGLGVVLISAAVSACSIPVFRYALEQWRPDPYEVLIYFRGEPTAEQTELVDRLTPEPIPGDPQANVAVSRIDLDGQVRPEFQHIWDAQPGPQTPWVIVRTPWKGDNHTVWQGPLSAESIETVLRSPVRMELVKRLAGGDSVVWLLLAGQEAKTTATLEADLRRQLQALQSAIALPEIDTADLSNLSVSPDQLGLKFSVLTLQRDASDEQLLINTLMTVKPGLDADELANQPMLFPIFGRGRVYFPLVGTAIEPTNLEDMARFLSGACQCTIKQQNPGVDLLTMVDWDAYVLGIETEKPLPPLTGLGDFLSAETSQGSSSSEPTAGAESAAKPATPATLAETSQTSIAAVPSSTPATVAKPSESEAVSEQLAASSNPATPNGSSAAASAALGQRVLWIVGGLTLIVAIAGLWLMRGPPR